jgi:acyl-CoA thioesterase
VLAETSPAGRSAVLSDHIPYVVVRSLADVRHATTVSATLRILGEPHGEWTLLDVELAGTDGAYCVGRVREWAADGRLVAVADQTAYTRFA